jgi:hypothetical protein
MAGKILPLSLPRFELVIDVAGEHHLIGIDLAVSRAHTRRSAVNDLQHFAVFEDQRTETFRRPRFTDAQVERVQMHVAGVLDCAVIELALQQVAHLAAVEQADLIAQPAAHGFFIIVAQSSHVAGFVGRVQMTVFEVALDAVFLDALLDDFMPAPAQVPDEIVDVIAEFRAHLFAHRAVAGEAAGDLAAIAPGGAPADLVAFDDGDFQAFFGEFKGRGDAGKAAADDHHVNLVPTLQRRVVGVLVEGGGVVGIAAFGHVSVHTKFGNQSAVPCGSGLAREGSCQSQMDDQLTDSIREQARSHRV